MTAPKPPNPTARDTALRDAVVETRETTSSLADRVHDAYWANMRNFDHSRRSSKAAITVTLDTVIAEIERRIVAEDGDIYPAEVQSERARAFTEIYLYVLALRDGEVTHGAE